jgi:hypothetical protein
MSLQHNTVNTRWQHLRPCRGLCSLWENESQENELRVLLLPGCPSIVTTFTLIPRKIRMLGKGKSILWLCGSMMSNSAHCRIINCPRVEAIGTFSKAPINLLNGTLPATTCLRKMAWGFEQIYSRVSRICEVYIRPSPLHCCQGFAHELLYQANNRAAEVTMYGEIEVYTKTTTE